MALTLSPPTPLRLYERRSVRMSKIKNGGLDQYGAELFKQQQFGTAGVEIVNYLTTPVSSDLIICYYTSLYV